MERKIDLSKTLKRTHLAWLGLVSFGLAWLAGARRQFNQILWINTVIQFKTSLDKNIN